MPDDTYFVRLKEQIASFWPHDVLPLPNLDVLRPVWIGNSQFEVDDAAETLTYETTVLFESPLVFTHGLVDGI